MPRWSRGALVSSCVAGLGYTLYVYLVSPDVVAVHYGASGVPDRWGGRGEVLAVNGCIIGLGTALLLALPKLMRRAPPSMLNLPNKEYWLSPEHRDQAAAKLALWGDTLGTGLNLLVITLQLLLAPHRNGPAAPGLLPDVLTMAFVLFALGSCVWLIWSFRLPAGAE